MHKPKVLYGILNWGLGHATRSSIVIESLIRKGCQVEVGCSGVGLEWLQRRFPNVIFHVLPDPGITYQNPGGSFSLAIVKQALNLQKWLSADQKWVDDYIQKFGKPDFIVSDHRPAFNAKSVPAALIAHQLTLPIPFWMAPANILHNLYLARFKELWLPDHPQERLSGKLSKSYLPKRYLGYLSALAAIEPASLLAPLPLWVISGPEPLRSHWEKEMIPKLEERYGRFRVVRGSSVPSKIAFPSDWEVVDLATPAQLGPFLSASTWVFCRAGYSTLMDLRLFGKTALLDPTPGQPEQEGLARALHGQFGWFDYRQSGFIDWSKIALPEKANGVDGSLLDAVLNEWLGQVL